MTTRHGPRMTAYLAMARQIAAERGIAQGDAERITFHELYTDAQRRQLTDERTRSLAQPRLAHQSATQPATQTTAIRRTQAMSEQPTTDPNHGALFTNLVTRAATVIAAKRGITVEAATAVVLTDDPVLSRLYSELATRDIAMAPTVNEPRSPELPPNAALVELNEAATARAKTTGESFAAAFTEVVRGNPALYDRYVGEQAHAHQEQTA